MIIISFLFFQERCQCGASAQTPELLCVPRNAGWPFSSQVLKAFFSEELTEWAL